MLDLSRRDLLRSAAVAGLAGGALRAGIPGLKIGVPDWSLRQGAKIEAIALAKQIGFDGLQVQFGRRVEGDRLPLDNPELLAQYRKVSAELKMPLCGTCVDRLHENGLKSDPLAVKWVRDSIRITKTLGVRVLLIPMFGKWAIQTPAERDYAGDALRELGPEAEKAGVVLGLEDTISAEDNVRIMERSRSKAVRVYYDVGNSTRNGFDAVKEIRWLGKSRICQMHFKDNPEYMGEGKIDFAAVLKAVKEIGYSGWGNLETDTKQGSTVEADMKRNLAFVRREMERT